MESLMQKNNVFNLWQLLFLIIACLSSGIAAATPQSRGDLGTNPQAKFIPAESAGVLAAESAARAAAQTPLSNVVVYDNSANKTPASGAKAIVTKLKVIDKVPTGPIKTVDRIVAYINKGVITSHQVDMQMAQTMQSFKSKGMEPPNAQDIRSRVVEQLIMQQIQLDMAARSGIKTSDIEVTNAINNIVQQQKMSLDDFKAMIEKQGTSFDDFRKQIRDQITTDKLKQRDVDGKVTVNDDEVSRILSSEAFKKRIDYNLADIIISIPEQATLGTMQQKEMLANAAYKELQAGTSFYQVAAKYSNSPNALQGGDLGWRNSAALPPQINNSLSNLKPGGYTNIIKMPVGFFIFKINDIKKHGEPQIVRQYHVRHILIKVNEITGDNEAHQKILMIKSVLDKDANNPKQLNLDFIKYAKQYSEDTSSINGGDIGWVSKGDTVPAFEQAMLTTPIGVISQPVHSPFGWHILEVTEVRDSNLTNDREKAEIRQELRENKAQMLYTQWLRDIRETAYVKMNDN